MHACASGHKDVIECLLLHGAVVGFTSGNGETALLIAARSNHPDVLEVLFRHGATMAHQHWWTIIWAASCGHANVARVLLENGVDANFRLVIRDAVAMPFSSPYTWDGSTVLFIAVCYQHVDVVAVLMDHGADIYLGGIGRDETVLQYLSSKWSRLSPAEERCLCEISRRRRWWVMWWNP
jgi:FOG: Ankyrin repeat